MYEPLARFDPDAPSENCDRLLAAVDKPELDVLLKTKASAFNISKARQEPILSPPNLVVTDSDCPPKKGDRVWCPYPDYGSLAGEVVAIAPDATVPQQATPANSDGNSFVGNSSYQVTIQPATLALMGNNRQCELQPGMEAEASIISRQETLLQFLLRKARLTVGV